MLFFDSDKPTPRLSSLRRNTIQGAIFSNEVEYKPTLFGSNDQLSNDQMENNPVEIVDAISSIRKPQSLIQRKNGDAVGETNNTDDTMDCYQMPSARDELDDSNSSIPTQNTGNESTRSLEAYLHHGIGLENGSNVEIGINKGIRRHKSIAGSSNSPILRSRHNSNTSQVESSEENVSVKKVINPNRKCSFSSFNECRYLEDDGKITTTYIFSDDTVPIRSLKDEGGQASSSEDQICVSTDPTLQNNEPIGTETNHIRQKHASEITTPGRKYKPKESRYSKSFSINADIRRKLFVNRYKEWSIHATKTNAKSSQVPSTSSAHFDKQNETLNPLSPSFNDGDNFRNLNSALNSSTEGQKIDFGDSSNDFQPECLNTYNKIRYHGAAEKDTENTKEYIDSHRIDQKRFCTKLHQNCIDRQDSTQTSSSKGANLDKQRNYSDSFPSSKEEVDGTSLNLEDPSNPQSGSLLSMTSHVSPPSYGNMAVLKIL